MKAQTQTQTGKVIPMPPCKLTKEDEAMITVFLVAKTNIAKNGIGIYFCLKNGEEIHFKIDISDSQKCKKKKRDIFVDEGGKFFLMLKNIKQEHDELHEIAEETAIFINKWDAFAQKAQICYKIKEELGKISEHKLKENGFPAGGYIDDSYVELQDQLSQIRTEQNKAVRSQQYEDAARLRDDLKLKTEEIMTYLKSKYPRKKVFKSEFLYEILFERKEDYFVQKLY